MLAMVHKKNNSHSIVMHPNRPHIKQPCTHHLILCLLNIQTQPQGQKTTMHPYVIFHLVNTQTRQEFHATSFGSCNMKNRDTWGIEK